MRLADVPPVVFSEAMRDVDLFVGVTSIGADRYWQDGGQDARRYAQWTPTARTTASQALTANAQMRRDVLARLLPAGRSPTAPSSTIAPRVRGDLRTYRIHLGSGNILMEPADTYLCIVPARGGRRGRSSCRSTTTRCSRSS